MRFRVVEPLRCAVDAIKAAWTHGRRASRKVLLVGDQEVYTREQQYAPLLAHRSGLRKHLGVALRYQRLADVMSMPAKRLAGYDVVGLKLYYRTPPAEALRTAQTIRNAMPPEAALVYFDGDDDLCVLWPELVSLVDLYVKKHLFADRSEYTKSRIGKTNLTDYVARTFGVEFADNIVPTTRPLEDDQIGKLQLGWNIGLDDKIRTLRAAHRSPPPTAEKDIDVVCRASVPTDTWLHSLRSTVIPQIDSLRNSYAVLTPDQHVTQDVYYQEMLRSRICFSPFGYGEICWRDFEAILCGCVLVKPDMSHVETVPNVFVPNETYVPVRWDYQDLADRLRVLLQQPEECERIRNRARRVLQEYLDGMHLTESFNRILELARTRRSSS